MPTKYRATPGSMLVGRMGQDVNGIPDPTYTGYTANVPVAQQISYDNHPGWRIQRGKADVGGPWFNQKIQVIVEGGELELSEAPGFVRRWAKGVPFPHPTVSDDISKPRTAAGLSSTCPAPISNLELTAFGTSAIANTAPTNPLVDTSTALAELVSGLPAIPGHVKGNSSVAGHAGGQFLNIQFGIVPSVNEMKDFRSAAEKAEKHIQQLRRDNGKLVRRRFDAAVKEEPEVVTPYHNVYLTMPGSVTPSLYLQQPGTLTVTTTKTKKMWFSGAFTYHIPEEGLGRSVSELDAVYGIMPGLDTAWNVVPFSWLLDWRLNIGDVMKNVTLFGQDGLVMKYGYVMCEQVHTYSYRLENMVNIHGSWRPQVTTASVVCTTQQRFGANPFGFGVKSGDLSARQFAILAALGISLR